MGKKEITMSGNMSLKTLVRTSVLDYCIFRWFICKYSSLELDHLYRQTYTVNGFNYFYKIIRHKGRLHVGVQCEYTNAPGEFYLTDGNRIIKDVEAVEIADGLYVCNFTDTLLMSVSETIDRRDGPIVIAFRFLSNISSSVQCNSIGQIGEQADFDELCYDIQSAFIDAASSDFILKFNNVSIRAHKSMLYARSTFFEELFTKDENATEFFVSETTPEVMYEVLLHVYGGELSDVKVESMVKVLEVAYLFKIPSLKKACFDFFDENNSWDNIKSMEFFEYKIDVCNYNKKMCINKGKKEI